MSGSAHGQFPTASAIAAGAGAALFAWATQKRDEPLRCEDVIRSKGISSSGFSDNFVLAADCGGTTTRIQLYRVQSGAKIEEGKRAPGALICEEKFPNMFYKSLEDIVSAFLRQYCSGSNPKPVVAVLAVAGIVTNNACRFTNLDWIVDGFTFASKLGIPRVEVINDFVAQGYGMLTLADNEMVHLNNVPPKKGAPIACIGAGTGLGQCFLVADLVGNYTCYPSEGGHAEFAPRGEGSDELQLELLKFLKVRFSGWNRISVERVVSGKGICNIYEFLAYKNPNRVNKVMHREFLASGSDAGIVAKYAVEGSLSKEALDIFASCYGAACGTMAINFIPVRGLFITGGVSKKMSHIFNDPHGAFMAAYHDKGRVSTLLEQVPVFLVKNDDMGQRGAHLRAVRLLQEHLAGEAPFDQPMEPVDKNLLVAPRVLTYGGEPSHEPANGGAVQREQVREMRSSATTMRNRRIPIDPEDQDFEPIFKMMMWRVPRVGVPTDQDGWIFREMWISRNGCLCYKSKDAGDSLVYWTREDLETCDIRVLDKSESCRPWSFSVTPSGLNPAYFAADSQQAFDLWLMQLQQLQKLA